MAERRKRAPLVNPLEALFAAEAEYEARPSPTAGSAASPARGHDSGSGGADGMDGSSTGDLSGLVPPPLLWTTLSAQLKPAEVDEVKLALGSSRIERNEDLHAEATALADILVDYQARNDKLRERLAARPKLKATHAQEMLQSQIRRLLSALRPKTADGRPVLETETDRRVYSYVTGDTADGGSGSDTPRSAARRAPRPGSAGTRPPLPRPASSRTVAGGSRPMTARSLGRAGSVVSAPGHFGELGRVDVFNVDRVVGDLRASLEDERQDLMDHIDFLQMCLEEEHGAVEEEKAVAVAPVAPGVGELREFEAKLQKQVEDQDRAAATESLLAPLPASFGSRTALTAKAPLGQSEGKTGGQLTPPRKARRGSRSRESNGDHAAQQRGLADLDDEHLLSDAPLTMIGASNEPAAASPRAPDAAGKRGGRSRPGGAFSPEARQPKVRSKRSDRSRRDRSSPGGGHSSGSEREAGGASGLRSLPAPLPPRTLSREGPGLTASGALLPPAKPRRTRSQRLREEILGTRGAAP